MRQRIKRIERAIQSVEKELLQLDPDLNDGITALKAQVEKRRLELGNELGHRYAELREATKQSHALRTVKELFS